MARPQRKKMRLDEETVNKLFQEIYDESHNIKAKIARLFTKWELKVKEGGEIQAIGDQIVKLIAAEAKNQDQKIALLKLLNDVVYDGKSGGAGTVSTEKTKEDDTISTDQRNELLDFVQSQLQRKEKNKQ